MNAIVDFKTGTEFFTAECCYIVEMFNLPGEATYSIARARFNPGVTKQIASRTMSGQYLYV